ncbi:MAG: radical SAM protein [Candidatus Omnitrophota bacterium]
MKKIIKKAARKFGLTREIADIPYYWVPYRFLLGFAFPPQRVDMELTYLCNLRCQMCPLENWKRQNQIKDTGTQLDVYGAGQKELTTSQIIKIIDDLSKMGVKKVSLTGGEPFLRKDIMEIIKYVKERGVYCSITNNGSLITRDIAEQLIKAEVDMLVFSIDGPEEVHNEIRGWDRSFAKICEGIANINEQKNKYSRKYPKIWANCVISALNQNYLSQMVDVAVKLDIHFLDFLYVFFTDEEQVSKTNQLVAVGHLKPESQILSDNITKVDTEILRRQIKECKEKARQNNINVTFNPALEKNDELEKYFTNHSYAYVSKCFYPWYSSRIDPFGNVYPCSIDTLMGNVNELAFSKIWNSTKYRNFRKILKREKLFPKCAKCCVLTNKIWDYLP